MRGSAPRGSRHCVIINTWPARATHLAALLKANFLLSLLQVRQRDRMCALPKLDDLLRSRLQAGRRRVDFEISVYQGGGQREGRAGVTLNT